MVSAPAGTGPVAIDRERCLGSGQCLAMAPEVFDQDEEDGLVIFRGGTPPAAVTADIENAVHNCPAVALSITN
ncbi:ferredoxin [Solwaraspora sp. WMMD937]|uniref:ferredoxin n=1 Tax=Solwaraspora sp. WMMD937 TaxID=3016090 RepID=UPI0032B37667